VRLVSLYAPNGLTARRDFFHSLTPEELNPEGLPIVLAGDFNCGVGGTSGDEMALCALVRDWRLQHRPTVAATHLQKVRGGVVKASWIDHFFVGENLPFSDAWVDTKAFFKSDHFPVRLELRRSAPTCQRRRILSRELTLHPLFREALNSVLAEIVHPVNWVSLTERLYKAAASASRARSSEDSAVKRLTEDRTDACERLLLGDNMTLDDYERLTSVTDQLVNSLDHRDEYYAQLREEAVLLKGEVMTSHFLRSVRLHKRVSVPCLRTDSGQRLTDLPDLLEYSTEWFTRHFQPKAWDEQAAADLLSWTRPIVGVELRDALDLPPTLDELTSYLERLPNGKTPGLDGLPNELFRQNAPQFAQILLPIIRDALLRGRLPNSLATAVVKLIPKPGKDPEIISSYRPISMLTVAYKAAAGILAARLKPHLTRLIRPEQTGFVQGREMIDNALTVKLIYEQYEAGSNLGGAFFLDFQSAFDRVAHPYLSQALRAQGFGEGFIRWVQMLLTGHSGRIEINGRLGRRFDWKCGVPQGCPLAPFLFILALEPLLNAVRAAQNVNGFDMGGRDVRVLAAADDIVLFARDAASLSKLLELVNLYERASGAALNLSKTVAVRLTREEFLLPEGVSWARADTEAKYLGFAIANSWNGASMFPRIIANIRERASFWLRAGLSLRGRVIISKMMLLSLVWYRSCVCDFRPQEIQTLQREIRSFVWGGPGKIPRVAYAQLILAEREGGLNATCPDSYIKAQRLRWIGKLFRASTDHPWKAIVLAELQHASQARGLSVLEGTAVDIRRIRLPTLRAWGQVWLSVREQATNASTDLPLNQLYGFVLKARAGPTGSDFREKWPEVDWPGQFKLLSSLAVRNKVHSFLWLLWRRGLATNAWLTKRTSRDHSSACSRCGAAVEDIEHLFIHCPAAQEIWDQLSTTWQAWTGTVPPPPTRTTLLLSGPKPGYDTAYDTLVAHTLWSIWTQRNALQFRNEAVPLPTVWQTTIRNFVSSMVVAVKRHPCSSRKRFQRGRWTDVFAHGGETALAILTGNAKINPLREVPETD